MTGDLIDRLLGKRIQARARSMAAEAVQLYLQDQQRHQQRLRAASTGYFGGWGRSSGAKWTGGQSTAFGGRIWSHWQTRQQARDIVEDSPHAYTLVHRKADTVIDTGLTLEPTPRISVLGMSPEQADAWAQLVGEAYDAWASSTRQHRAGLFSFKQVQHMLMVGRTRDNDEFLRLYYSSRRDLLNELQFEILDPNEIRGDAWTTTHMMQLEVDDGIIRGPDGSERAYKIWIDDDGRVRDATIPRTGEKSGRLFMLHGFSPEYPGQGRGYSQLGVTMQEFEDLEDYVLSIVKKAINQSQLVAAIENKNNPPSNPFENLGMPPAGPAPTVSTPPGSVAVTDPLQAPVQVTPLEEAAFSVPGSTLLASLAEGDEIKLLQNTVPTAEFEGFLDSMLTPLLAAHGMSLELFKIRFEASYSAARGALQVLWRIVEMERRWLDTWCIAPVYEMWLSSEIAAGRVSCPGWNDPRLRAAWCAHQLVGSPPVQIDPVREADAQMKYLQMSATTLERVAHEHGGGTVKANIARNRQTFPELPTPPWAGKAPAAVVEEKEPEPAPSRNGRGAKKFAPAR